jgi:hypothetical protein
MSAATKDLTISLLPLPTRNRPHRHFPISREADAGSDHRSPLTIVSPLEPAASQLRHIPVYGNPGRV